MGLSLMPEYDKRKIIKVGEGSLAITIPKKWCQELKIHPGDVVSLIYSKDTIIIKPLTRTETGKEGAGLGIAVDVSKRVVDQLVEEITACYTEGVMKVRLIKGTAEKINELINKLKRRLAGIVLLKPMQNVYEIVFMDVNVDLKSIIERLVSLITEILDIIRADIEQETKLPKQSLKDIEEEVEKLYYLGLRIHRASLANIDVADIPSALDTLIVLRDLRDIANAFIRLEEELKYILVRYKEEKSGIYRLFMVIRETSLGAISSYMNHDIDLALLILSKEAPIRSYIRELTKGKELTNIINEINLIINNSLDIARTTISKCVRDIACRCRFYPKLE